MPGPLGRNPQVVSRIAIAGGRVEVPRAGTSSDRTRAHRGMCRAVPKRGRWTVIGYTTTGDTTLGERGPPLPWREPSGEGGPGDRLAVLEQSGAVAVAGDQAYLGQADGESTSSASPNRWARALARSGPRPLPASVKYWAAAACHRGTKCCWPAGTAGPGGTQCAR